MNELAANTQESESLSLASIKEGQTVAGKYVVGRTIGVGGMGVVFAAYDQSLDRRVAIKVLLPRLLSSATAARRFLREARAATRITSEHVVKLLEVDTLPDGTPLLVMEHLAGLDLRALLRERGPLPARLAVDYLLQALQAVAEAHTHGIVHRDLKPSNLFLTTRADGTPLIKVLDFGIAKTLEEEQPDAFSLTSSEDVRLGSPMYMPPEQLQNPREVDARADIWALGVTLYELVCGRAPFRGQSYAELVSAILSVTDDSLEQRMTEHGLPVGLGDIVQRCLRKKREQRFGAAAELAAALAPFGSDDARLSLSRVAGIARTPLSSRASTFGSISFARDSASSEATISLPIDAPLDDKHSTTSPSARPSPRFTQQRVGAMFAVTACAIGVFASLFVTRETPSAAPATTVTAREPATPSTPRAAPTLDQTAPQAAPSATSPDPAPKFAAAKPEAAKPPKKPLPVSDAARAPNATSHTRDDEALTAPPSASGTPNVEASATGTAPATASFPTARSRAIEDLIRERH